MSIPLFDPIQLPPGHVLMDLNGLEPEALRQEWQGKALEAWLKETETSPEDFEPIDWNGEDGIFAVCEIATEAIVGVAIVTGVEGA